MSSRSILVTGSHRSGSTWVGRMIALSPEVTYVHEPFSPIHRPGICRARFHHWYTFLCDENADGYRQALAETLALKYQFREELRACRSTRDIGRMLRDAFSFTRGRVRGNRVLIKDPIAFFSAEWLAQTFSMDVVVLIRHPAAFVGSLKRAGWTFRFANLFQQPMLMQRLPACYRDEIQRFTQSERDIVDQGILLWRIIHTVILEYQKHHPEWIYLRHEDLARDPQSGFGELYDRLGLQMTPSIEAKIRRYCSTIQEADKLPVHAIRRDSSRTLTAWKQRLSRNEIHRIRKATEDIASRFYGERDW
ncbi:sulfotransferase [Candidatus Parcubacteria bacterium]|nr:MAG: sulfotransferase [Candidatus Parcubacteria bacterium]